MRATSIPVLQRRTCCSCASISLFRVTTRLTENSSFATSATGSSVAQDGKYITLGETPQLYMFLAALQDFPRQASIVIRTNSNPDAMIAPVRDEIRKLDPQLAILGIQTIDQFRDRLLGLPN